MKSKRPLGWTFLGTFEVKTGKIGVWDPCYGSGDEFPAVNGTWEASVEVNDEGDWGHRIARLSASCPAERGRGRTRRERHPQELGVDSGQMGIYDLRGHNTSEDFYDLICDRTLEGIGAGLIEDWGAASSSGFGDGGYTLYLWRNEAGLVVEVLVDFIPDEDES